MTSDGFPGISKRCTSVVRNATYIEAIEPPPPTHAVVQWHVQSVGSRASPQKVRKLALSALPSGLSAQESCLNKQK